MSDTPRTNAAQHNMGSVLQPDYVVDVEVAQDLELELVAAKKALRVAVGLLLIMPQFSNIHPDDMLEAILKETREKK